MLVIERGHTLTEALVGLNLLRNLNTFYPDFEYWYTNSVMPGVLVGKDILLLAKQDDQIVGVALGKRNNHETKLRCVRVQDSMQGSGLGLKLIDQMLDQLECATPHCTVAQEMMHDYSRAFVKRYGFRLSDVTKGEYRRGRLEYHWN